MRQPSIKRLAGRRILLTREASQNAETAAAVRRMGGEPLLFPCLEIACLEKNIRQACETLDNFTDLLFTSRNGVRCVGRVAGGDLASRLAGKRIAAVGDKTAAALQELGIEPAIVAQTASQEGVVAAYRKAGMPASLLFFRAEEGRDLVVSELAAAGSRVQVVSAYRMRCPDEDASATIRELREGHIDAVLLGSPKTVRHYLQRINDTATAGTAIVVAISQQVAATAAACGLHVQVVAKDASFDAMLDALASYYESTY